MKKLLAKIIGATTALAMAIGVGVGIASNTQNVTMLKAAAGDTILAYLASGFGTSYGVKTGETQGEDGVTDYGWVVTAGGNSSSLGSNNKNFASVTKLGDTYAKYGTPAGISSTETGVSAFALTTSMENVGSISYSGSQAKGTTQEVYAIYSSNNTTFSLLALTGEVEQGASFSSGSTFEFDTCTGYFALVFKTTAASGDWRIDSFNASFYEGSTGGNVTNYNVTFYGLNNEDPVVRTVAEGGTITNLPTPIKTKNTTTQTKYEFAGWYTVADPNNPVFEEGNRFTSSTHVNSDLSLYAKYNEAHYNIVSFNSNGGSSVDDQEVNNGGKATIPTAPTKASNTFAGWYTTENCDNNTEYDFDETINNSDFTLYAKWNSIAIQEEGLFVKVTSVQDLVDGAKYLITYDNGLVAFNGGLETLDATSNTVDTDFNGDYILKDSSTEAAYFTIDTTNHYIISASGKYIGRSANSNGLNASSAPSADYTNTISFDGDGNVVITASGGTTLRYNTSAGQNRFRYFTANQQAIQLYKFARTYTVTFDTNEGTEIASKIVIDGNTLVLPDNPTKSPDGSYTYTFEGWYTNDGLTEAFNPDTPITSNMTLFAKYTAEAISNPRSCLTSATSIATIHGRESSSVQSGDDTIVFEDEGLEDASNITTFNIGSVTLTFDKAIGSNAPKYYNNGKNARAYANNTITFESSTNITAISFNFTSGYSSGLSTTTGTYSDDNWSGEATSILFNVSAGIRIVSITVTYGKQITSVTDVALRFGATVSKDDWDSIKANWTISDYGVMMMKAEDLENHYASIEAAFNASASSDVLKVLNKCINDTPYADPYLDGDDYLFTVKVNFPNNKTYFNDVIYAAPFIVVDGTYYFLDEMHTSVKDLADDYHGTGYSYLSDAALAYLKA